MTCLNSVTTSTGKFTLYADRVTRCQAKKRCKEKGQILAPIKNKSDLNAIKKLQKNNDSAKCVYSFNYQLRMYHIGLDVKNVGGTLLREFTDGTKWDDCEMKDLYMEFNDHGCPHAIYMNIDGAELSIEPLNDECNSKTALASYICLEPAGKKEVASSTNLVQESSGGFSLTSAIGGTAFMAVCVFATIGWVRMKIRRCEEKMKKMEEIIESRL